MCLPTDKAERNRTVAYKLIKETREKMVEFGLKLEDNKVADWSDNYIRYEKLKEILKKAGAAAQRYEDLAQKHPDRAARVHEEFRQGSATPKNGGSVTDLTTYFTTAATSGTATKTTIGSILVETSAFTPQGQNYGSNPVTDTVTPNLLFASGPPSQQPNQQQQQHQRQEQQSSFADANIGYHPPQSENAFSWAISGVSDYISRAYERQVRELLKEKARLSTEFRDELYQDISRVNFFYTEQLRELEERLTFLKESAVQSFGRPGGSTNESKNGNSSEEDKSILEAPLIDHNELSLTQGMRNNLAGAIRHRLLSSPDGSIRGHRKTFSTLSDVLVFIGDDDDDRDTTVSYGGNAEEARKIREARSVQRALLDQYRTAKLLHNFAIMNYTGFVKIVKKHDKSLPDEKNRYKIDIQSHNICNEGKQVEELASRMEKLYANWFCGRDLSEARAQMLPKRGDGLHMDWSQLRLGYRMGMCSILGLWVCWDCIWGYVRDGHSTIGGRTAFPVFRGCFGLILLEWFWGCSVWVWSRYRVNYIYIMDLDPSIVESPIALFNHAVDDTLVFLILMLLYYKAGAHDIPGNFPAGIFSGLTVFYGLSRLMLPLRTRVPMWKAIFQVVTSPMSSPSFFHSYVGDIFTSTVKVFQDLVWTFFFIISGDWLLSEDLPASTKHGWSRTVWYSKVLIPLVTLLPLWFRFNQCLRRFIDTGNRMPHVANAFKYALTQTVTLFGAFHPLYMNDTKSALFQSFWTFAFVASSIYSFTWDVYMDWGLGLPKYNFLGPRLMYPKRSAYYMIIAVDFVLRFAWVLTLVPPDSGANFALPAYLNAVSMMMELFRRTLWGFLRLENEHRSNTAGYRRVGFVPLHFSTGHTHEYHTYNKETQGFYVLLEVACVTILVLGAAVVSVVAAQHATLHDSE